MNDAIFVNVPPPRGTPSDVIPSARLPRGSAAGRAVAGFELALAGRPGRWGILPYRTANPLGAEKVAARMRSHGFEATHRGSVVFGRAPVADCSCGHPTDDHRPDGGACVVDECGCLAHSLADRFF